MLTVLGIGFRDVELAGSFDESSFAGVVDEAVSEWAPQRTV